MIYYEYYISYLLQGYKRLCIVTHILKFKLLDNMYNLPTGIEDGPV